MKRSNRNMSKKSWFVIPFVSAGVMLLLAVVQVIHMITPQVGVWAPPDRGEVLRTVSYPLLIALMFMLSGVFKLVIYKKEKKRQE
ncbi:hypothetical protein [Pontibacillus salipaludis]|uniref:Uncharacterized protein n=1 Tax=Pontibacillus salipaludis TaxID=1697394 RepID=A0ABQ1Q561_9BACI|nr:hypothetical protein [Pontibacillus salipaludis]GGD14004.1 hypothetical protein GCM10011389_22080 [Pontibacillus salipaludis]